MDAAAMRNLSDESLLSAMLKLRAQLGVSDDR
jgi:hypothetical protein